VQVWYFAYGSNLDPRTFLGRRRMRPAAVRTARLRGYRLVFDLPIGPGERAVANVEPHPDSLIHGVAYQLSVEQAAFLDQSEGVPQGAYRRIEVDLELGDDSSLRAFTYESSRRTGGRKPSRRYLGLLLHGAQHHGLAPEWIAWLRDHPIAVDERDPQRELFE
jgi:gamma-glutamylcyclotransferase (GGCT)/AIG2-like uncharacterized protein YtfP